MKTWLRTALLGLGLGALPAVGEPDSFGRGTGRDGALVVREPGQVLNRYAQVSGPTAPGDTVLLVADPDGFSPGDLVMVLQATGLVPEPVPGRARPLELSRDAVGQWEFARVSARGEGSLTLSAPLVNAYAARVTQIIRVPEYTRVHIREGAQVRAEPWNGRTGGVVAFLATGEVLNEGTLSATGAGFRGGAYVPEALEPALCLGLSLAARPGARKGEGIAVTQYGPTATGREAVSHGGGGGLCPSAGGGGGGNGGPGGRGGAPLELTGELLTPGGEGGAKLVYSLADRLSFGGGGGSGQGEDELRPEGGAGGGAVFIRARQLSGRGSIVADGAPGGVAGRGGAGGGGAGGSIHLRFDDFTECGGVSARGGVGGGTSFSILEEGVPGGGGGGGRVLIQASSREACPLGVEAGAAGSALHDAQPSRNALPRHAGLIERVSPTRVDDAVRLLAEPVITKPTEKAMVSAVAGFWVEGTADRNSQISIFISGGQLSGTVKAADDRSWKMLVTGPAPGNDPFTEHSPQSIKARATLGGSNAESDPVKITLDLHVPKARLIAPLPPSETSASSLVFTFRHDDECTDEHKKPPLFGDKLCDDEGFYKDVYFECSTDDVTYVGCTSPKTISTSTTGTYRFFVRARDVVHTGPTVKHEWSVDRTAPVVSFGTVPDKRTRSSTADFTFQANEPGTTFRCARVKKGETAQDAPCSSPQSFTALAEGTHVFKVSASDRFGNTAVYDYEWQIDVTGPTTRITSAAPESPTRSQDATFVLVASEPGSSFECALDARGFVPCNSPVSYSNLGTGLHVFYARSIDDLGNVGAQTGTITWEVDTVSPVTTLVQTPDLVTKDTFARFVFRATKKDVDFACKLDNEGFKGCGTNGSRSVDVSKEYSGLSDGKHVLRIRSTDPLGNTEATPVEFSWTVDTKAPTVEITQPTQGSKSTTPFVTVTGTAEFGSELTIFFDGVRHGVTTADTYNGTWLFKTSIKLEDGEHELKVKAVDQVKLEATSPAVRFIVNTFRPETKIDSGPPSPDRSSSAVFVFSSPNARQGDVARFTCQLDSRQESACEKTQGFSSLTNGAHSLRVRAWIDDNEDLSPELYEWVVSIEPPNAPEILQPADGDRVRVNALTFSGHSVANGRVHVFIKGASGVENGIALTGADRTWTFTPSRALTPGEYTVAAQAEDEAGNKSNEHSRSVSFVVDPASTGITLGEGGGGISCAAGGTAPGALLFWGFMVFLRVGRRRN